MYNVQRICSTHTHVPNTCMCYMCTCTCTCSSTHGMSVNKLNASIHVDVRIHVYYTLYIQCIYIHVPSRHKFHLCESFTLSLLYCRRKLNSSRHLPLPPLTSPVIVSGRAGVTTSRSGCGEGTCTVYMKNTVMYVHVHVTLCCVHVCCTHAFWYTMDVPLYMYMYM